MGRHARKFATIQGARQREKLVELWKTDARHYTRMRAHAILLSDQGREIGELVEIFSVDRNSVSRWIERFDEGGVEALHDADRPGGPPLLEEEEQQILYELLQEYPNRPAKVLSELQQRTGKEISDSTLRNYARRFGLVWKRFRRSLRDKRDEKAFRLAQEELAEMIEEPDADVVYFDEAAFSLQGVVPYGWQPIGERLEVPVSGARSPSVQALGFEHQDGSHRTYLHRGSVTSETVIQVFDDYSQKIDCPTVVILDNASCHTSAAFEAAIEQWAERGLLVYHLPKYSPELNAIERFWKKLKHRLMPPTAWERFNTLVSTLTKILNDIGEVCYTPSLYHYAA